MPDDLQQVVFEHNGQQYSMTVPTGLTDAEAYEWAMVNRPKFAALGLPSPSQSQVSSLFKQAIPTMAASEAADFPGAQKGLSAFTGAAQRQAKISEGYEDYMRGSGRQAAMVAGTMATGGLLPAVEGAGAATNVLRLAGRVALTGVGAGSGDLVGGGTPKEAAQTAAMAAASQPVAEGLVAAAGKLLSPAAKKAAAPALEDEWRKINEVVGVKPRDIRIGENASSLEDAATMPGRALAKAGLTSEQLAAMNPLERQAAIQPIRAKAAQELDDAFAQATASGKKFDVGKSVFDILKRIKNPKVGVDLQQQAVDAFNHVAEEAGITNQRATTPQQARILRGLLAPGARFSQAGDLSALGAIRAELYRAVNRDLRDAFPELRGPDQFYSDVKGASTAARNAVAKMATKAPEPAPPTVTQKAIQYAKKQALPWAIRGALGASGGYVGWKLLRDMSGAGMP